jgi:PKD repeat protein
VQFTDRSTANPTAWSWNFGDGTVSTEQNPTHTYTKPGTFSVSLRITTPSGGFRILKTGLISVQPSL